MSEGPMSETSLSERPMTLSMSEEPMSEARPMSEGSGHVGGQAFTMKPPSSGTKRPRWQREYWMALGASAARKYQRACGASSGDAGHEYNGSPCVGVGGNEFVYLSKQGQYFIVDQETGGFIVKG